MDISTSTNLVAFQPGKMRNPMEFCIEECAKGGYKVLDINFCECMNPYSRMRNDDWETYVKELGELGKRWGVTFRQSHLPYYDVFKEPELNQTMEQLLSTLTERQQQVLRLRFGMDDGVCRSLEEVGKILGISKERARQIERQSMDNLKKSGSGLGLEDFLE